MNKRYTEKRYFKDFRKGWQTITMCCNKCIELVEFDETEPFNSIAPYNYYLVGEGINRFYELEEKATPKKVKEMEGCCFRGIYTYSGYCPGCDGVIRCEEDYLIKHCTECGQRLDWSKEEEQTKE